MLRLATRLAGLALCAGALSACTSGGSETAAAAPPASPLPGASGNLMATNVNDALAQAQVLRTSGDFQGATRVLAQLMLAQPDDPRVVGEYGKLLAQENRPDDAVNFLRRAVELQPGDWTLYSALGVSYDQLNDHADARIAYEHALALKPGEAAVLNNYAMSRMLAGDNDGARMLMAKAEASGSTDPRIVQNLALLNARAMAPATAVAANTGVPTPVHPATAPARVVMQDVPTDAMAGPVKKHDGKPARKVARKGRGDRVADGDKPAKKTKPATIPALRQTADASKP